MFGKSREYVCPYCNPIKVFRRKAQYILHMTQNHSKQKGW